MDDYKISNQQIKKLKELHRSLRDKRQADRVKSVVLLGTGWTPQQVAEALLLDEKTVRSYFQKFCEEGKDGLIQMDYAGKQPLLSEEQEKELANHLDEKTYQTSKDIRQHIKKMYGIKFSATGVKHLLKRLGFVYKKPKHVPGKLDPAAQKAFIKEYEKLLKTKGENDPVYFVDACHPQHNSIPAYGWIRRGVEKELPSNGGRKRVNINGAVDIKSVETVVDFSKTINDRSTLRLFRKLEKKHPDAIEIHVILDNASYYKSKWLQAELAGSKIVPHYLPGYSPNLNVIERLWKFFKKKILSNTYYEKFEDFLISCKNFFRCRTRYRAELRALLTDNFHLFKTG